MNAISKKVSPETSFLTGKKVEIFIDRWCCMPKICKSQSYKKQGVELKANF